MNELQPGIARLRVAIEQYNSLSEDVRNSLVKESVGQWIFSNNKIESAGLASEGDTISFVLGHKVPTNDAEREVAYTLDLLVDTYNPNLALSQRKITPDMLQNWHKLLASGTESATASGPHDVLPEAGQFRTDAVRSTPIQGLREKEHIYPHHNIIAPALYKLTQVLNKIVDEVEKYDNADTKLLYTFGIAVFVQYHFVDIHPFKDGNGRMCRFLSKYLLDGVCPIPFPYPYTGDRRFQYLSSLVEGDKSANDTKKPLPLARFMLDAALTYYGDKIHEFAGVTGHFVCGTLSEVSEQVNKIITLDDEDTKKLRDAFNALRNKENTFLILGKKPFDVKRLEVDVVESANISLDDL